MTEASNAHAAIEAELQCWKCRIINIPHASPYIVCDLRAGTASCDACGAGGPIAKFHPPPKET